jgi:hypothetical protein
MTINLFSNLAILLQPRPEFAKVQSEANMTAAHLSQQLHCRSDVLVSFRRCQRLDTVHKFFHQHNGRGAERIEQRLEQIGQAIPATYDAAVVETCVVAVQLLARLIATLRKGIAELDRRIEKVAASHPDFALFDSLPGAGKVMAPRLIVAFGTQRERYSSAKEIHA